MGFERNFSIITNRKRVSAKCNQLTDDFRRILCGCAATQVDAGDQMIFNDTGCRNKADLGFEGSEIAFSGAGTEALHMKSAKSTTGNAKGEINVEAQWRTTV